MRPLFEERPSSEQWKGYLERFGSPPVRHFSWGMKDRNEGHDHPVCRGEAVILIANRQGHIAYVRKRGEKGWSLPMGRVNEEESIEEAAVREAWEETGTMVRIHDSPAIYVVTINFAGWDLRRWHFVFRASTEVEMHPRDKDEIGEARFFEERPWNPDPIHRRWLDEVLEVCIGKVRPDETTRRAGCGR